MMKLLIIDDEAYVRRALKSIMDWSEYGYMAVAEAADGEEGLQEIRRLQPDLVLLDIRMPKMNGLALLQTARNEGFNGKFVIISRSSRFDYAKKAIQYGVEAYLQKPVDKNELLETVLRVNKKIEDESIMSLYESQRVKKARTDLIYDLLSGKIDHELKHFDLARAGLLSDIYQVAVIQYSGTGDRLAFLAAVREYADKCLDIITIGDKIVCLVGSKARIIQFNRRIKETAAQFDALTAVVLSRTDIAAEIPQLYQEAEYISDNLFYYAGSGKIIDCAELAHERGLIKHFDLPDCIETLYNCVITNQTDMLANGLHETEIYLRHAHFPVQRVVSILLNLYYLLEKKLYEMYPEIMQQPVYEEVMQAIGEKHTLQQIMDYMQEHFTALSNEIIDGSNKNIAKKICSYINLQYTQPLKLSTLANAFSYNSSYLGRTFKNYTKESFSTYLEKVRIEKSKELLVGSDEKIFVISEKVGFSNIDYFCKKFKQYVGSTPSEYRRRYSNA